MTATSVSSITDAQALARRLLDGDRSIVHEARVAVDAAVRLNSTDRALHAAALLLAFYTRDHLGLRRSRVRGWMPGLDELMDSGHLDAAAYAAPRLQAAYPNMPYLEFMTDLLQHLPARARNGRQPFVNDHDSDVQVVPTPGADTVVIAFTGARHRFGLPISVVDRYFGILGCHVIYLRDRQKVGYIEGIPALGFDMAKTIHGLSSLVSDLGAERIVCMGNSAGGTGALNYAIGLGAERVLALAPITGGKEYLRKIAPSLKPGGVRWNDLVSVYRDDVGVRVRIIYGEKSLSDRQECLRMAGLPNVTVEDLPGWESHHVVNGLLRVGRLEPVLRWLTSKDDVLDVDPVIPSPTRRVLA